MLKRCAQIVPVSIESGERAGLAFAAELGRELFGERKEEVAMPVARRTLVAAFAQPFERVLADRLQHREAHVRDRGPHRACQTRVS